MADITVEPTQASVSQTTSSSDSLNRRACRICQSETGVMMRPCGCIGTVGDIHETCLNQWVCVSQKKNCEICNEEYHQSGSRFKPLNQWALPKPVCRDYTVLLLLVGQVGSIVYMLWLFHERKYFERWQNDMDSRSDDWARIFVLGALITCLFLNLVTGVGGIRSYFKRQKEIRFLNKEDQ